MFSVGISSVCQITQLLSCSEFGFSKHAVTLNMNAASLMCYLLLLIFVIVQVSRNVSLTVVQDMKKEVARMNLWLYYVSS